MPAGKPTGPAPEKFGKTVKEDVKQESTEPSTVEAAVEQKPEVKEPEVDLDEKDLDAVAEEAKKIPYSRFKEVNEKAKRLEQITKQQEAAFQAQLQRAAEDAELRAMARFQKQKEEESLSSVLEPWEKNDRSHAEEIAALRSELQSLKSQTVEARLHTDLQKLKDRYPDADEAAVLGWKRANPNIDLEEAMEMSHQRNNEMVERKVREIIERKKKQAQKPSQTTKGATFKLDGVEKPKSLGELRKVLSKLHF